MDKTQAVFTWAKGWPDLDGYLKLNALNTASGEASMATVVSDRSVTEYIDGTAERVYTFALNLVLDWSNGYDSINGAAMALSSSWLQWVADQDAAGNLPGLPNAWKVEPLQDIPALAMVYEVDSLAKYQFQARVYYRE